MGKCVLKRKTNTEVPLVTSKEAALEICKVKKGKVVPVLN
jgi:hypothetical protein